MMKVALPLLVAPLALAACGSSHASSSQLGTQTPSQLRVQRALDKTASAPSFRSEFTDKFDLAGRRGPDVTLRGDVEVDNRSHLVRIRFAPTIPHDTEQVSISSETAEYTRFPGQGWLRVETRNADSDLSDIVDHPEYVISHLRVQRVTALGEGHFRVWAEGLEPPLELWIASTGYITQMHMIDKPSRVATTYQTVKLSDFGRPVHLTIPAHLAPPPSWEGTD